MNRSYRTSMVLASVLLILTGLLLTNCGDATPPVFTEPPEVAANPNPAVPLAAVVRFATDEPVNTTLQVSDGSNAWELNYDESRKPEEGLPVVGMRPDRRHEIQVSIRDAAGNSATATEPLEFTTPPLPSDRAVFPPVQVRVSQPERMEPGITILSVRRTRARQARAAPGGAAPGGPPPGGAVPAGRRQISAAFGQNYGLLLGLNEEGDVVWYYRGDARISDFEVLRNGNIVYLTHDSRAVEIDVLGDVVAEWYASKRPQGPAEVVPVDTLTFHHEIEELPSGNLLVLGSEVREIDNYYSSDTDPDAPRKKQKVMGDEIVEFARDGAVVWRWRAFEHLDPFFIGHQTTNNYWVIRGFPDTLDWTHANGMFYDERDDSILLNVRKLSAVVKLDHTTGEIRWILSEPTGWPEEFGQQLLKPEGAMDWPWYQHAPKLTPAGTVLVFNNAIWRGRPFKPAVPIAESYSRAAEYAIDPETGTVRHVWSSEGPGPGSVTTFAMGDADWLPATGNVLICYGGSSLRSDTGKGPLKPWPRVREVTHTDPAEVVYEVVLADDSPGQPAAWLLFGSERVARLGR